jgi:hypothetical protein
MESNVEETQIVEESTVKTEVNPPLSTYFIQPNRTPVTEDELKAIFKDHSDLKFAFDAKSLEKVKVRTSSSKTNFIESSHIKSTKYMILILTTLIRTLPIFLFEGHI